MKKTFYKFIACMCVAFLMFGACACGGGNGKKGKNGSISVMLLDTGIGTEWIEDLRDSFYDETGISVSVDSDTQLSDYLSQNMGMDGDVSDDIYMTNSTYDWIQWAYSDYIEDLTDLCNEEYDDGSTINSNIQSSIRDLGKVGDHRYILQFTYAPTGIVYNKDLLKAMYQSGKISYESFPTRWDDLVTLAHEVVNANYTYQGHKVYAMVWGDSEYDLMDTFKTLWAQGNYDKFREYFAQENELNEDLFVSQERLSALEALYDLIDPQGGKSATSVPSMLSSTHAESYLSFLNGNALFCFAGSWFETEMGDYIDEDTFEYCFAPIPAIGGNDVTLNINYPTEYFFIPKCSENAEKAKQFLKFMFREDNLIKIHNAIQTPLAFEYDTSALNLTRWGGEVQTVLNNYGHTVAGASSLFYQVAGLRPELEGNPFQKIYNGSVAKANLTSLLTSDYSTKSYGWKDKVTLANLFKQAFEKRGIL